MTVKYLKFKNINSDYMNNKYFVPIKENTFIFHVIWSYECNCAFLSIYNENNQAIITGRALVNNLVIRNYNLPYTFYFFHENRETYEPTIDNISEEYVFVYDDGEV